MNELQPLDLTNISKRYHMGQYVIENLTYHFEPNSATGLVGPNGSGKTTLMRLLSTAAYPTQGTITYGSLNIHEHPHQYLEQVGVVSDEPELPQYLTAVELLEWICRSRNLWDTTSVQKISELLDRLSLDERRNNLIGTYSSGMMKKTQLAAALIIQPEILILDEPLRGLDLQTRETTMQILTEFKNAGILILSSHMKESLESLCDQYLTFPLKYSEATTS
ncbi:MAG TPA: ABC transporter ATP-binding protein [Balneolales bacterium]|nr:ABC transporter ATP-binding protein [Balneolales bacterium]